MAGYFDARWSLLRHCVWLHVLMLGLLGDCIMTAGLRAHARLLHMQAACKYTQHRPFYIWCMSVACLDCIYGVLCTLCAPSQL